MFLHKKMNLRYSVYGFDWNICYLLLCHDVSVLAIRICSNLELCLVISLNANLSSIFDLIGICSQIFGSMNLRLFNKERWLLADLYQLHKQSNLKAIETEIEDLISIYLFFLTVFYKSIILRELFWKEDYYIL